MDVEPMLLRNMKEPQERHRVLLEEILGRYRQPLAVKDETAELPPPGAPAHPGEPALALLIGFEDRAEDSGQIADVLGDQEIILHEPLDPAAVRVIRVAHLPRNFGLQVESEPFFGATGQIVEMAAQRPKKTLGVVEPLRLLRRQNPQLDQLADIVGAIDVLGDPEQRVQVPQAALALLDVRLELVTTVADALVPCVALGELAFDELRCSAAHDVRIKTPLELAEEGLLAPQIAGLEQPRADRQIGFGLAQAFLDGARRLPDLQAEVP